MATQNNRKLVFVSFADLRYRKALERMKNYTENLPFTERHLCNETNCLGRAYWHRLKPWLYRRGFGYWKWKADLIREHFNNLREGDILVYSDGGIVWNSSVKALQRFDEYIGMLSPEKPILAFEEPYVEQEWTKGDLLKAAGVYDNEDVCRSNQYWGGVIFILKSAVAERFLDDWIALNDIKRELITDKRSDVPNKPGFKEHRHDQSTFSITLKRYPHVGISWQETQPTDGNWTLLSNYPINARRTKEMGRPVAVILRNKLMRPWRMALNFYFRRIRDYEFMGSHYPW